MLRTTNRQAISSGSTQSFINHSKMSEDRKLAIPAEKNIQKLLELEVKGEDGKAVKFNTLIKDGSNTRVVTVFIRHFFCGVSVLIHTQFHRKQASDWHPVLRRIHPRLDQRPSPSDPRLPLSTHKTRDNRLRRIRSDYRVQEAHRLPLRHLRRLDPQDLQSARFHHYPGDRSDTYLRHEVIRVDGLEQFPHQFDGWCEDV